MTAADVAFEVKDTYEIQSVTMEEDYTKIDISKKDITGEEELPGAHLKLLDDENNVIDQWVSGENPHRIERLSPSKTYTLVEEIPADGYSTAESIEFTVEDSGEIQTVVMNDDITRIEIHKVMSRADPLPERLYALQTPQAALSMNGHLIQSRILLKSCVSDRHIHCRR